jgi:Ca-activated chloride channel homolog
MSRRVVISMAIAAVLVLGLALVVRGVRAGGPDTPLTRAQRPDCTPLNVSASSEKAALLSGIADTYNRADRQVGGRCVDVRVATLASGTAASALAADWDESNSGPRPDVWTPASSLWCGILEQRLNRAGRPAILPDERPSLAQTPLVIAMPRPMAEVLGWPDKDIGWSDLAALARDPAGWGGRGHPEWGSFKLGKTNPNISTSGMAATAAAFYAATGRSTDLTADDLADPAVRDFVTSIEGSTVHYGDTTLTFLQNLYDAAARGQGLTYVSAVAVEEKSVWDYNQGNPSGDPATLGKRPPPQVPLVAIYPNDGTLVSDNPYLVLTADWVDDAKRAAAADFLSFVHDEDQQKRFQGAAFRNFEGAPGDAISPENGMLPDRRLMVLRAPRPSVLNQIVGDWAVLRKKANLIFVLDVSGSMSNFVEGDSGPTRLDLAKRAVQQSLGLLNDDDVVSLWDFSSDLDGSQEPYRIVAPPVALKDKRDDYTKLIDGLQARGGTALYATTRKAVDEIRGQFDPKRINAVVVLTDGVNEYRKDDDLDGLKRDLDTEDERSRVRVFPIAYAADSDFTLLDGIAKVTTARAYKATDPKSIDKVLRDVVSNF